MKQNVRIARLHMVELKKIRNNTFFFRGKGRSFANFI